MSSHTYEESKSIATKTIILLAIITVVEVVIAYIGKGIWFPGLQESMNPRLLTILLGGAMIILSLYKAVKIVFEFMHMSYEVPALSKTVLLPLLLLVWGVIAFLWEGTAWKGYRQKIIDKNEVPAESQMQGMLIKQLETEDLI